MKTDSIKPLKERYRLTQNQKILLTDKLTNKSNSYQKHIERIGKLKNCVAYGPGILDLAHQPDEYIGVDDMLDSAMVMAISLSELLK